MNKCIPEPSAHIQSPKLVMRGEEEEEEAKGTNDEVDVGSVEDLSPWQTQSIESDQS